MTDFVAYCVIFVGVYNAIEIGNKIYKYYKKKNNV